METENSKDQDNGVKLKDLMGKMLEKTIETTKTVATKANETYRDPELRQSMKKAGNRVCNATKEVGVKIVSGTRDTVVYVKDEISEKGMVKFSMDLSARLVDSTLDFGCAVCNYAMSTVLEIKQNSAEKGIFGYTKELTGKCCGKMKQVFGDVVGFFASRRDKQRMSLLANETQLTSAASELDQESLDEEKPSSPGQVLAEKYLSA